ncbi:MAG: XTP/dITP diphosphatase [Methanobacteriota archaeon]
MQFLFATGNKHKVSEANEIGGEFGVSFKQIECPYPELRSDSISEVAKEGARFVFNKIGKPVVVEDSGLFIQALDDFPGTYSAFVFSKIGNFGILKLMDDTSNRTAEFRSCIAFYDGKTLKSFVGSVKGDITEKPVGENGFGYDPLFIPNGCGKTFAEDQETKKKVSHRSKAVKKFLNWYSSKKS